MEPGGCFGVYLGQRLSWFVLVQDALLLGYAAVLIRGAREAQRMARLAAAVARYETAERRRLL